MVERLKEERYFRRINSYRYPDDNEEVLEYFSSLSQQPIIPPEANICFINIVGIGMVKPADAAHYHVYYINVHCANALPKNWVVYRRYSEFEQLFHNLVDEGYYVPEIPPKSLFGSLINPNFLKMRKIALEAWLHSVAKHEDIFPGAKSPLKLTSYVSFLTEKANSPPDSLIHFSYNCVMSWSAAVATQQEGRLTVFGRTCGESDYDGRNGTIGAMLSSCPDEKYQTPYKSSSSIRSTSSGSVSSDRHDDGYLHPSNKKIGVEDFILLKVLGQGSFGRVTLVQRKSGGAVFAMKVLRKDNIVRRDQVRRTQTERTVLEIMDHPFIVKLIYAFQTSTNLYFVLEFAAGGELFFHLTRMKRFSERMVRFYTAEIVLALKALHKRGICYRDLKPENILLDAEGHIMLADFGLAKDGMFHATEGSMSICGTPEYLPPEMLKKEGHGTAVDWWSLGMVTYELLTGLPPWYTEDKKTLFQRIKNKPVQIPAYLSPLASELILELLKKNPNERLGARKDIDILDHPFYNSIDWHLLYQRRISPPFHPFRHSHPKEVDTRHFDPEFTSIPVSETEDAVGALDMANAYINVKKDLFLNFSYDNVSFLLFTVGAPTLQLSQPSSLDEDSNDRVGLLC